MPTRWTLTGCRITKPILDDADIVRREIPQGIDVGPDSTEVQPLTVDIANLAQLAGVEQLLHIPDRGVVDERMAHHDYEIALLSQFGQFIHLGNFGRERLLDKNVLASISTSLAREK